MQDTITKYYVLWRIHHQCFAAHSRRLHVLGGQSLACMPTCIVLLRGRPPRDGQQPCGGGRGAKPVQQKPCRRWSWRPLWASIQTDKGWPGARNDTTSTQINLQCAYLPKTIGRESYVAPRLVMARMGERSYPCGQQSNPPSLYDIMQSWKRRLVHGNPGDVKPRTTDTRAPGLESAGWRPVVRQRASSSSFPSPGRHSGSSLASRWLCQVVWRRIPDPP